MYRFSTFKCFGHKKQVLFAYYWWNPQWTAHDACWFTSMDMWSGFHQIKLQEGEEYKTTFQTVVFRNKVMPYGLTDGPSTVLLSRGSWMASLHLSLENVWLSLLMISSYQLDSGRPSSIFVKFFSVCRNITSRSSHPSAILPNDSLLLLVICYQKVKCLYWSIQSFDCQNWP
jgi:hypothetical protein